MNSSIIEIISVISLTILGISLLTLVISILPILTQVSKLTESLTETVKSLNERILPNLAEFSELFSGAKKIVDKGQNISDKITKSAGALTEGFKAGLKSYFQTRSKKTHSSNLDRTPID